MAHRNERYDSYRMTCLIYQKFNIVIQGEFTLENFAGAFCVLAAGLVIACFVAVMEILDLCLFRNLENRLRMIPIVTKEGFSP